MGTQIMRRQVSEVSAKITCQSWLLLVLEIVEDRASIVAVKLSSHLITVSQSWLMLRVKFGMYRLW